MTAFKAMKKMALLFLALMLFGCPAPPPSRPTLQFEGVVVKTQDGDGGWTQLRGAWVEAPDRSRYFVPGSCCEVGDVVLVTVDERGGARVNAPKLEPKP